MKNWKRRQRHLRAALSARRPRVARIRPGTLPGSIASPEAPVEAPRITVTTFTREGAHDTAAPDVEEALASVAPAGVTWLNVEGLGDPCVFTRLGERFGLHPLALEDVLNVPQRPKVERYDKHLFVILRMIRLLPDHAAGVVEGAPPRLHEEQVSLFLGPDWVITIQERGNGDCFEPVRGAIRQGRGRVREAGADYLAYLLLDAVVDGYFPALETLADRMEALEGDAIERPTEDTLVALQRLRHDVLTLRRAVWPVREELAILQREDSPLITAETRVFLRDAYDHAIQALEIVESLRETAASVMDVYLSAQNQRLNSVMKVLTVIATLFMPLTFIASIYGMNFAHMPELQWSYGYPWALGLMAVAAAGMVAYFKRRGWW